MAPRQQPPPPDPQAAQAGLAILVGLAIERLWPSLDLLHLRESLPTFTVAVAQEVRSHAEVSATMAARQYRLHRAVEGAGTGYTPRPAELPPLEQITAMVDWATQPLWTAEVLAEPQGDAASIAVADAKARLAASSERLVLDTGRDTILNNVQADPKAKGWARIPEPDACYFCALLATRGAVYKRASFDVADARFKGEGVAKTHDHCRCHMEPIFTAYEPSARVREWEAQYIAATRGASGSKAAQLAWRRAYEGRTAPSEVIATPAARPTPTEPLRTEAMSHVGSSN